MSLNPFVSAWKTLQYALAGRLHFPRERIGAVWAAANGQRFTVFRYAVVDPAPGQPAQPGAVFIPRFHVAGMSVQANIRFSRLLIPFFVGLPGFRSKCWLVDEQTGDTAGYYEWDTVADAENYRRSIAARFMTRRSTPGSVTFTVYPAESAPPPPRKET